MTYETKGKYKTNEEPFGFIEYKFNMKKMGLDNVSTHTLRENREVW